VAPDQRCRNDTPHRPPDGSVPCSVGIELRTGQARGHNGASNCGSHHHDMNQKNKSSLASLREAAQKARDEIITHPSNFKWMLMILTCTNKHRLKWADLRNIIVIPGRSEPCDHEWGCAAKHARTVCVCPQTCVRNYSTFHTDRGRLTVQNVDRGKKSLLYLFGSAVCRQDV
jgi:hypothetical protein